MLVNQQSGFRWEIEEIIGQEKLFELESNGFKVIPLAYMINKQKRPQAARTEITKLKAELKMSG